MTGIRINKFIIFIFFISLIQYQLVVTHNINYLVCVYGVVVFFPCLFLLFSLILPGSIIRNIPLILFYMGTLIISLPTFRPGGEFFNGSDLLYLLSAITLILQLLYYKQNIFNILVKNNILITPLILFVFGAILSLSNTIDVMAGIRVTIQYFFLFGIWFPLSVYILDSLKKVKVLLAILVIASLCPLLISISDYFFHTKITYFLNALLNLNLNSVTPVWGRFGSIMDHPNNLGIFLISVFPLSLWLIVGKNQIHLKVAGAFYLVCILICSITTGSRSVILAIFCQTVIFFFIRYSRLLGKRIFVLFLFCTLIVLIGSLGSRYIRNDPITRLKDSVTGGIGNYDADIGRIDSVKESFDLVIKHPIAGIGVDAAGARLDNIFVHNTILRLWVSTGILGLVAAILFYIKPLITALKLRINLIRKNMISENEMLSVAFTMTIGWVLSDLVQPQFHNRIKWISVVIICSLVAIERKLSTDIYSNRKESK